MISPGLYSAIIVVLLFYTFPYMAIMIICLHELYALSTQDCQVLGMTIAKAIACLML